jgi:hypothetical protein
VGAKRPQSGTEGQRRTHIRPFNSFRAGSSKRRVKGTGTGSPGLEPVSTNDGKRRVGGTGSGAIAREGTPPRASGTGITPPNVVLAARAASPDIEEVDYTDPNDETMGSPTDMAVDAGQPTN